METVGFKFLVLEEEGSTKSTLELGNISSLVPGAGVGVVVLLIVGRLLIVVKLNTSSSLTEITSGTTGDEA